MSHAWLFTGPPGLGPLQRRGRLRRRAAVRAGRPGCGECHACHTVLGRLATPTSRVIRTEKLSIGVDEVRDLVRRSALAPGRPALADPDRRGRRPAHRPGLQRAAQGDRGADRAHGLDALRADRRGRAADDPVALPAGHADHARPPTTSPTFLVRADGVADALASYAARASQGHIGRARALARDEATRNRRREVVAIPARLTSLGACMTAAANLADVAKEEADAITGELDAREKADLDTAYGVVERGRRPARVRPRPAATSRRRQKTRAKRRHLDVVDRGLMDLVSVYRDAIALASRRAGSELVNEEIRGDVEQLARVVDARAEPAPDRGDLRGPRADARVQRAGRAGAGVDDGRPAGCPRGARPVKRVVAVVLVVLSRAGARRRAAVVGARAGDRRAPTRPRRASADAPTADARARRHRAARRRRWRRSTPRTLDWEACGADNECATLDGAARLRATRRRDDRARAAQGARRRPATAIGSTGRQPRRPRRARHRLRRRTPTSPSASRSATRFDIVGFDPRGTGASDARRLPDRRASSTPTSPPTPTRTPRPRSAELRRPARPTFGAGCVEPLAATWPPTSPPSRRPATWTSCAPRSATTQLTYFGASYGTKLGATYAELFPDKVGRMVLDGAVDLSLDQLASPASSRPAGFETALTAYVEDCVDDAATASSATPSRQALDRITDAPRRRRRGAAADRRRPRARPSGNAFYGIVAPLYNKDYWAPSSTQGLKDAFDGDGTTLLLLSDFYASRGADGSYTDNSSEAIYAINCLDDPYVAPAARGARPVRRLREGLADLRPGLRLGPGRLQRQPGRTEADPIDIDGAGAAPIVVIGTTRDPATPYEWAAGAGRRSSSPAVLLSRDGDGHTGYNIGQRLRRRGGRGLPDRRRRPHRGQGLRQLSRFGVGRIVASMTTAQAPIGSGFGFSSTADDVLEGIDLTGRLALVTGGYSGIGTETTRALARAGARVVVPARRPEKAAGGAGRPRRRRRGGRARPRRPGQHPRLRRRGSSPATGRSTC